MNQTFETHTGYIGFMIGFTIAWFMPVKCLMVQVLGHRGDSRIQQPSVHSHKQGEKSTWSFISQGRKPDFHVYFCTGAMARAIMCLYFQWLQLGAGWEEDFQKEKHCAVILRSTDCCPARPECTVHTEICNQWRKRTHGVAIELQCKLSEAYRQKLGW